jgi:hypothetical protein
MDFKYVRIVVGVPRAMLQTMLDAIAAAGAGVIGEYSHCSFTVAGMGRFKPSSASNPFAGEKGVVNQVDDVHIETFCAREQAKAVTAAIRMAHPYEAPVVYLIPMLSEDDL